MTKWKFLTVAIVSLVLATAPASAQDNDDDDDSEYVGCEMLSTGIGAALYYAGTATAANAWTVGASAALAYGITRNADGLCNRVTEETVDAFENAMNNLGIQIMWHTYHDPYMDWCLSIREYDCIPYIGPGDIPDPNQQAFVSQSWEAVRSAAEYLLDGGVGNSARITPHALGNALRSGFEESGLHGTATPFHETANSID